MKVSVSSPTKLILQNGIAERKPFSWDALWVYHPRVIKKGDRYYLFYTGKSIGRGVRHAIGLAVSQDYQQWKKLPKPILPPASSDSWDDDFTAHSFIYGDTGKYYMLYDGSKKNLWRESIGLAMSRDLVQWTRAKKPILSPGDDKWEKHHVSRASIFRQGKKYHLFYTGHDGERERIGLAAGSTIRTLKRVYERPIIDVGKGSAWDAKNISDPQVLLYRGAFLLFYSGIDNNNTESIGLAVSQDLKNWKKYKHNPIFAPRGGGEWDGKARARFDITRNGDRFNLFYSGKANHLWSIGYTTFKIDA